MNESIGILLIIVIAYLSFHALFEILLLVLDALEGIIKKRAKK